MGNVFIQSTYELFTFIVGLIIIAICCYFVTHAEKTINKISWILFIPTICGGLLIYLIGYWPSFEVKSVGDSLLNAFVTFLRAVFSTGRMFIVENDFNDVNEALKSDPLYLLAFGIVHSTALFLFAAAALSWFGETFESRLKLLFKSFQPTYIICGLNDYTYKLAEDIINNSNKSSSSKKRIIFIEKTRESELFDRVKKIGAIFLEADPSDELNLKRIISRKFNKPLYIIVFTEDEVLNISISLTAMKELKEIGTVKNPHIFVHTSVEDAGQIFDRENNKNKTEFDIRVFNEADISSRQLMDKYPLYNKVKVDYDKSITKSDLTVLIVGFGDIGRQFLLRAICCGQFVGGRTRFIVVDNKMPKFLGKFKNKYPELMDKYEISMVDIDVRGERFYSFLKENIHSINYIVVALGDDSLNIDVAFEIKRFADRCIHDYEKHPFITVNVRSEKELVRCPVSQESTEFNSINIFGQISDIFTEDIVINESMDIMAKAINTQYNKANPQFAVDWDKLSSFDRESNRAAAMHIKTKLMLSGLSMCKNDELKSNQKIIDTPGKFGEYLGEVRLNNLSVTEHLRWNAFHFASGWTVLELDEVGSAIKPKDSLHKRHACLVEWDMLKEVALTFNKEPIEYYQNFDIDQVLSIPEIVKEAGYTIFVDNLRDI